MKFDDLMPGFVAADHFHTTARAIQPIGEQPNQCFVGRRLDGRRGDPDSQFVAIPIVRQDFVGGRARLKFYREQDTVRLGAQETRKWCRWNRITGCSG